MSFKKYIQRLLAALRGRDVEILDLEQFNKRYGLLDSDKPMFLSQRLKAERGRYLYEELQEFLDAETLEDMADALIDIVYIAKGTARMMGLPWEDLWDDVQEANMRKEPASTARSPRDVIKPGGWLPPDNYDQLRKAGWPFSERIEWSSPMVEYFTREYPEFMVP